MHNSIKWKTGNFLPIIQDDEDDDELKVVVRSK